MFSNKLECNLRVNKTQQMKYLSACVYILKSYHNLITKLFIFCFVLQFKQNFMGQDE